MKKKRHILVAPSALGFMHIWDAPKKILEKKCALYTRKYGTFVRGLRKGLLSRKICKDENRWRCHLQVPTPTCHDVMDCDSTCWGLVNCYQSWDGLRYILKEPKTEHNKFQEILLSCNGSNTRKVFNPWRHIDILALEFSCGKKKMEFGPSLSLNIRVLNLLYREIDKNRVLNKILYQSKPIVSL